MTTTRFSSDWILSNKKSSDCYIDKKKKTQHIDHHIKYAPPFNKGILILLFTNRKSFSSPAPNIDIEVIAITWSSSYVR